MANHDTYDRLLSALYSDEEREKIEWGLNSVLSSASNAIQKHIVSWIPADLTISECMSVVERMFPRYCIEGGINLDGYLSE